MVLIKCNSDRQVKTFVVIMGCYSKYQKFISMRIKIEKKL